MLRVLSVDPGEKVGWATATVDESLMVPIPVMGASGLVNGPQLEVVNHGISSLKAFALKLHALTDPYDIVIYETWRLSARAGRLLVGNDMQTSQLIGIIRLYGWLNGVELVAQPPSAMNTARKTAPPWLQEIIDNEPKAHDDAHNVSALLHLWTWYWGKYV